MSTVFWVATIIMALLAFSFVAMPLIKNNRRVGLVAIAISMPIMAAGLYWFVGSPQAASQAVPARAPMQSSGTVAQTTGKAAGSVASLVDGLAARLEENPEDGKSWLLLARSYKHLHRIPDAQAAYNRAAALGEIDEELAALSESTASAEQATAQIFGKVQLGKQSEEVVLPTDTVFIFARAVGGPPMPVAVLRRPVSELPLDFLLNDSQAMSADAKLSDFEKVIVTARISRSGVATDALQGLEARSDTIVVAENRHLELIIE